MAYPIRRILVAVREPGARDFPAAHKAAQLARRLNAELCLFHAIATPIYAEPPLRTREPLAQVSELAMIASARSLERLAASLRIGGLKVATATDWDYPVSDAIIRAAIRFRADLVVAECHRATPPFAWFLHFTDWDLVRTCPLPILLVKGGKPYHRSAVLAAVDPTHARATAADLDEEILRYGAGLTTALGGALHAVHAYAANVQRPAGVSRMHAMQEAPETQARAVIDPLLQHLRMPAESRHFIEGPAAEVIESVTRDVGAQILVMGAVSRSGVKRLVIGDTAARMLDRMSCDILIVKPARFGRPISVMPRGPQIIFSPALSAAVGALSRLSKRRV
jgi:universal stress protein E